jgi:hypothetical protein
MAKKIAFIHKKTLTLTEVCGIEYVNNITPMSEYFAVIINTPRPVPTVEEVQAELVELRAKYPDVVTKYTDDDGVEHESISYGKYSELGLCAEPYEEIL